MANNKLIKRVAKALGREPGSLPPMRPPLSPDNGTLVPTEMVSQFLDEVEKLSGEARLLQPSDITQALSDLIQRYQVRKAALWTDPKTSAYQLRQKLAAFGVAVVQNAADKRELADCDLGITTVDFGVPSTGTIGLLASPEKPKAVSLIPRVHLAIVEPYDLRESLTAALTEVKNSRYLVLVSGPSRTSDIELTLTLGVHGPKNLVVWMMK